MAATALLVSGCAYFKDASTLERLANNAKLATYVGAGIDLIQNPGHLPAYKEARRGLSQLLVNENFNATDVMIYLDQVLPVDAFKSPTAKILLGATMMVLQDNLGSLEVQNPEEVRVFATAMRDGLDQAIQRYEKEN